MTIDKILNDAEKAQIQTFLNNPIMKEAVKKILLAGIYINGTLEPGMESDFTKNWAFSLLMDDHGREFQQTDEQLGQRLRASIEGVKFLETGFQQLEKFKITKEPEKSKDNPAR